MTVMSRFSLGQVVATSGALDSIPMTVICQSLDLHASGDWGEIPAEDWNSNELALLYEDRIVSIYSWAEVKFWIITEADRSITTILLPEEY